MKLWVASIAIAALSATVLAQDNGDQYGSKYQDPDNLPAQVDGGHGQTGYNDCVKRYGSSSSKARCKNAFINSVQDFCLFSVPDPNETVGNQEANVVSYCTLSGRGTRLIPAGTIHGAHFVRTPGFVQISGTGDLTKLKVQRGDQGGELDPHGATGAGNPNGGLVFTNVRGKYERLSQWNSFISYQEFCMRACFNAPDAGKRCPHIYDTEGCQFSDAGNYDAGVFEDCEGENGKYPGIYGSSTWYHGQHPTPPAQAPGASSNCKRYHTVTGGMAPGSAATSLPAAKNNKATKQQLIQPLVAPALPFVQPNMATLRVRSHHTQRAH